MSAVVAALAPVFLLIVIGFGLRRSLIRLDSQWHGLERLTYYVLFPALLLQSLVKADLTQVPVAGIGGALFLAMLAVSALCLALRPPLARSGIDGPAFTSIFQGATRWQTYVALGVSRSLFGPTGLAVASVGMIAIIPMVNVFSVAVLAHYASPDRRSMREIATTIVRNPLIWACVVGLALNVVHMPLPKLWHDAADALGQASLPIGLLVTGAGLHFEGLRRAGTAAALGVVLKLVLMPILAIGLAQWFGVSGPSLVVVAICAAVPTSPSAYVLAKQMGGDAPLLAQIISLQTVLAALTMPVFIALVGGG
ncbi:AEC family transporter [Bradyrhizobium sp. HKCCYLRH3099]|uniref:AEC family transporter n=1 Tax=unclassified Bradyrhizobium TaxID=2631580 RepID=UPI003EB88DBD